MSILVTTRGLGSRGGLLVTGGLGRRILDILAPAGDSQKFYDMRDYTAQALKEDEELLTICQGLLKIICR